MLPVFFVFEWQNRFAEYQAVSENSEMFEKWIFLGEKEQYGIVNFSRLGLTGICFADIIRRAKGVVGAECGAWSTF